MIVTSRDFRANQSRYISIAHRGEDVILKSRVGNVRLMPVDKSQHEESKRDLAAELRSALADVKESMQGKRKLLTWEELLHELDD